MKVVKVFGAICGYGRVRAMLKTDATYTPYVICTNYNPEAPEGQQWDSAYGYYRTIHEMANAMNELQDQGYRVFIEGKEILK